MLQFGIKHAKGIYAKFMLINAFRYISENMEIYAIKLSLFPFKLCFCLLKHGRQQALPEVFETTNYYQYALNETDVTTNYYIGL